MGKNNAASHKKQYTLLWLWKCRASKAANAHFYASDYYNLRHNILTVFNVLSAIAVLFFTNNSLFSGDLTPAIGIAGLFTVLSTALQHIMSYGEVAHSHKIIGNEYSNMKRKIERLVISEEVDADTIHRLSHSLNWIGKSSPPVKRAIWKKSTKKFRGSIDDLGSAEIDLLSSLKNFGIEASPDVTPGDLPASK